MKETKAQYYKVEFEGHRLYLPDMDFGYYLADIFGDEVVEIKGKAFDTEGNEAGDISIKKSDMTDELLEELVDAGKVREFDGF